MTLFIDIKQGIDLSLDAFEPMRNGYAQVGLGVPTGIDLPGEVSGVAGEIKDGEGIL